jgi:cytochrome c-type protein NapC
MRFLRNLWGFLSRPSPRYALGILVAAGVVLGILFWGAFNWAIELSSTETFCISCHEMRSTVFEELKKTVHYRNESGVTAICADCHVPKNWFYKIRRKVEATFNEVPKHLMGVIDTREKFEAKRLELAEIVWERMKSSDSRACRNCHHMDSMDLAAQRPRARVQHQSAIQEGDTCIDCHKGIAHKAVHKKVETEGGEDEGGFTLE